MMSVAQVQGSLWGAQARDYSTLVEGFFRPLYERVFDDAGVSAGTRLLDVGCGPGLAANLAAGRGAVVAGLDAAEASIAIARERTPDGDFRVGDMEGLPWPGAAFDVVTGFNAFQFADMIRALREARRVAGPGGRVAMAVWGRDEDCDTPGLMAVLRELLPPAPPGAGTSIPLSATGRIEALMREAALAPVTVGEADCPFTFPDLGTAVRGLMSAGAAVAVVQRVGVEPAEQALVEALGPFRTDTGAYHLKNRFRYVIASP